MKKMNRVPPTQWGHMVHMELHDQRDHRSRQTAAQCDPKWDNPGPDLQDSSAENRVRMCRVHEGCPVGAAQCRHPALALKDSAAAFNRFKKRLRWQCHCLCQVGCMLESCTGAEAVKGEACKGTGTCLLCQWWTLLARLLMKWWHPFQKQASKQAETSPLHQQTGCTTEQQT